jgi:signal transduction histidine kinase/CheY-like chemotaxis protein
MSEFHSLLKRQLKKFFGLAPEIPRHWKGFIQAVDTAYVEFDEDRKMLERSLELSSQELLQANSELRIMFQSIPDLLFTFDYSGKILDCKAGTTVDLYLSREQLMGKLIQNVPPENLGNKFLDAIKEVKRTGKMVAFEYPLRMQDQQNFYEARLMPLLENQIIAIVRNITVSKRADEELLKTSKLESIGILAGGIAHDFNNILTAIIGNICLAGTMMLPGSEAAIRLADAEKASLRAQDLTRQLLAFSRGGEPIKKLSSISDLLRESAGFVLSGSNVRCEYSIVDDLLHANIDQGQISQVINNLVINAKQAMPNGGAIRISAENVFVSGKEPENELPLTEGIYVKITIQDEGPGIPAEQLNKIFDPYYTTKQTGSGLGLTTSYAIIRRHGGRIFVKSGRGCGAIFSIYLPASKDPLENTKEEVAGSIAGKGRILIMDDEEMVRDVLEGMLVHFGYEVAMAGDGAEALKALQEASQSGKRFDAVIMDLTIPGGIGGREAAAMIREFDSDVKLIVSSGYSNNPIMSAYRDYGFSAIMPKPFNLDDVREVLSQTLSDQITFRNFQ